MLKQKKPLAEFRQGLFLLAWAYRIGFVPDQKGDQVAHDGKVHNRHGDAHCREMMGQMAELQWQQ